MTAVTYQLQTPLPFGDGELTEITVREPTAGDCRGLSILKISELDVAEFMTLISRISMTHITVNQLAVMPMRDMMKLIEACSVYFLDPKDAKDQHSQTTST